LFHGPIASRLPEFILLIEQILCRNRIRNGQRE
jgi:hypothetical protein